MAKQERSIRTRRKILEAAASVFEEHGYGAAKLSAVLERAEVTKGALYFHFTSKEELAYAVLDAQTEFPVRRVQRCRLQEFVDIGLLFAHRLSTDVLLRGSVRLTLDRGSGELDRSGPYRGWIELNHQVLKEAQEHGEVLPHVDVEETARIVVGGYAGINLMTQITGGLEDLEAMAGAFYRHVLPGVAAPGVLGTLDMAPDRGARLLAAGPERSTGGEPAPPG
ncbi:ScbR family autoregulator-binding transcription factor [Streptomyces amakusaensis]|uniref:ScbR family autoregulator-binding transcription factor n=1 Tax=Streptomyces amakusaensis TaxID=67271 RepID=A0ABW0ASK7_9ACTN